MTWGSCLREPLPSTLTSRQLVPVFEFLGALLAAPAVDFDLANRACPDSSIDSTVGSRGGHDSLAAPSPLQTPGP